MEPLIVERRDAAAILSLNRPDRLNALNAALVEALTKSVETAIKSGARLIVFRGEGKGFSAGFDIDGLDGMTDGDLVLRFLRLEQLLQSIHHAPVATLALAHGACFGAAADLVAVCRWRVAAPSTRFRMPGLRFGVVLGTRRLAHLVGTDTARCLLESSKVFGDEEALATGFLNGVAPQEAWRELIDTSLKTATALAVESQAALLACTVADTRDADLAALARSVAQPGLKERMSAYIAGLQRQRS
jgi:enoyl-CoA hydratase/carnithine racemase